MSESKTQQPPATRNGILSQPVGSLSGGAPARRRAGGGEGMDRKVKKRRFPPKRVALIAGAVALAALLVWGVFFQSRDRRLNVEADRLTISTVTDGTFQEYIPVTGTALPIRTIYLDAVVGGQVEGKFVEEGAMVEAGQPLVQLSNDNLTLQMLGNEAQLQEQINGIRNTRLALDQNELNLRQQLSELEYQVERLAREYERNQELYERRVIAEREFEEVRDEYEYMQRRLALTRQGYRQDSLARSLQIQQMEGQLARLQENLALVSNTMNNLVIRAPIDGQLSLLDAEVGASKAAGSRIGQIDDLSGMKVRVPIDEHYIARVSPGLLGQTTFAGADYELEVVKVYPEVRDGRFEVDMEFTSAVPDVRRGQSLRIRLELGDPADALLLARGGFFTTTGGNWAYVLTDDGDEAVKRPIRLGRQNPQFFEVTEGLAPGDRVVTSGYDTFGDADRLVLQ
ncbi:MAG: HlyD family efflux transporter periplasmic adaptor subunit [Rhodothermales bacterium]|nr:HlyD family efflux transporter periplasmic adaptor subunit [Rhodothermales bacterium]